MTDAVTALRGDILDLLRASESEMGAMMQVRAIETALLQEALAQRRIGNWTREAWLAAAAEALGKVIADHAAKIRQYAKEHHSHV